MMVNLYSILLLITGGAIGTLLRYGIYRLADSHLNQGFPWGTLIVNLIGSFMIGVLWSYFDRTTIPPAARLFLFVGILGSFTTFSAFAFDSLNLFQEGAFKTMLLSIFLNNVLGIGLCFAGYYGVKLIFG
jgi:fluoride exporter